MSTKTLELAKHQVEALFTEDIPFRFWGIIYKKQGEGVKKRAYYKVEIEPEFESDVKEILEGS